MYFALFCLTLLSLANCASVLKEQKGVQSYRVKGQLFCGSKAAKDVQVMLIDDDFGPDEDDVLDSGFTDEDGKFELAGQTKELTTIDPHLKLYHACNWEDTCQRRWKFELPNSYITKASESNKVLDIGSWNLEAVLPGESKDCNH